MPNKSMSSQGSEAMALEKGEWIYLYILALEDLFQHISRPSVDSSIKPLNFLPGNKEINCMFSSLC